MHYEKEEGRASPIFFEAKIENGILRVPESIYQGVSVQ